MPKEAWPLTTHDIFSSWPEWQSLNAFFLQPKRPDLRPLVIFPHYHYAHHHLPSSGTIWPDLTAAVSRPVVRSQQVKLLISTFPFSSSKTRSNGSELVGSNSSIPCVTPIFCPQPLGHPADFSGRAKSKCHWIFGFGQYNTTTILSSSLRRNFESTAIDLAASHGRPLATPCSDTSITYTTAGSTLTSCTHQSAPPVLTGYCCGCRVAASL